MAIITETRQVQGFDQLSLEGFGEIFLTQGETESLTIEADESLLPYLKSDVEGGRLRLGMRSWLDMLFVFPKGPVRYTITMKNITAIKISGSGKVTAKSIQTNYIDLGISGAGEMHIPIIEAQSMELRISGSGEYHVGGTATRLMVRISGAGKVAGRMLACDEAGVHISGSGDVSLAVSTRLDVHISGSGTVHYIGKPHVSPHISGAGRVEELHE